MPANSTSDPLDARFIAAMRLVLAASALMIIYVAPSQPNRLVAPTYATLSLYTLYSLGLYLLALRRSPLQRLISRGAHWADVGWYVVLIALSSGTSSIFFFGFFFATLVASFRWGFREGMRVALGSTLLFVAIGLISAPEGGNFELNRSLVRPVYLLVVGSMMAYWGGYEIRLKQRLALLKDVGTLSNPRFGVDHTIGTLLVRMRSFYDADICMVVDHHADSGEYRLRRADRGSAEDGGRPIKVPAEVGARLLTPDADQAIVVPGALVGGLLRRRPYAISLGTRERTSLDAELGAMLIAMLDARSMISVPLHYRSTLLGRLYIVNGTTTFDGSDVDFLLQIFETIMPVIDNIRLVDRLASDAAEAERQRIARDLHDSVIQPYIGLQLGLAAVQYKARVGDASLTDELGRLYTLSNAGIADLRNMVRGLRSGTAGDSNLPAAIQRFASKFSEATGIAVAVQADGELRCSDRLAAEVFQMVTEGLSNIRRHTQAEQAWIGLARQNGNLVLRIENEGAVNGPAPAFVPRSLTERATALGGQARVMQRPGGGSIVEICVPL